MATIIPLIVILILGVSLSYGETETEDVYGDLLKQLCKADEAKVSMFMDCVDKEASLADKDAGQRCYEQVFGGRWANAQKAFCDSDFIALGKYDDCKKNITGFQGKLNNDQVEAYFKRVEECMELL